MRHFGNYRDFNDLHIIQYFVSDFFFNLLEVIQSHPSQVILGISHFHNSHQATLSGISYYLVR